MSSVQQPEVFLPHVGPILISILVVSLAYAMLTAQLFAWLWGVVALGAVAFAVAMVWLFYRLVLAVEQIAAES